MKEVSVKPRTLFKNIVGERSSKDVFPFKRDKRLDQSTARYFLIKGAFRTEKDEDTLQEKQVYYSYVYSTGFDLERKEWITTTRCLDLWDNWRFSFNDRDFLNKEMIEIIMEE